MTDLADYVMTVSSAALVCALVKALVAEKCAAQEITRIVCGMFLALTIIAPLKRISVTDILQFPAEIQADADAIVSQGTQYQHELLSESIKSRTESYILDKAKELHAEVQVQVTVSTDAVPVPKRVVLWGNVSPYAKRQIQSILVNDLGIPEEDQLWI